MVMVFISFGKWAYSSGSFLIRERYYYYGKWTPFVRVKIKGLCVMSEMVSGEIVIRRVDSD